MRTAEDYLENVGVHTNQNGLKTYLKGNVIELINKARKETIEECAERARIKIQKSTGQYQIPHPIVDKQSILSLINELK